jgi:prefoldin subunit 2
MTKFGVRLVLSTLDEALEEEPDRKCFRLIGGVLVERTVKDVVPALQTNRDGVSQVIPLSLPNLIHVAQIKKVIATLTEQIKSKEQEFEDFKRERNIRVIHKA